MVNLALVVKNWGTEGAGLTLDGKKIAQGKDFWVGHRHGFQTSDLIVWIRTESSVPVSVTFAPEAG